jgi:hypothetical protein
MFEIGVISIVVLAVSYWVTLWLMGRHDDVLHGDFVHEEGGGEGAAAADRLLASRSPFPPKPIIPARPAVTGSSAANSSATKAIPAPTPASSALPAPAPTLPERSDTLQTLLASIKQDLKDASQL